MLFHNHVISDPYTKSESRTAGELGSAGFTGCGKTENSVILSEAKNLSLFLFLYLNRREILRFAQNDRTRPFFRSLFSLWGFELLVIRNKVKRKQAEACSTCSCYARPDPRLALDIRLARTARRV